MIPNEIVNLIYQHLSSQICPIYTASEVIQDLASLCIATNSAHALSNYKNKHKECITNYTKDTATQILHLNAIEFEYYSGFIPKNGVTRSKKPRLHGSKLRIAILKKYNGCVLSWLCDAMYKQLNVQVPTWFASYLLPLPTTHRIPTCKIGMIWAQINAFQSHKDQLGVFIKLFLQKAFEPVDMYGILTGHLGSNMQRKDLSLSYFNKESDIYRTLAGYTVDVFGNNTLQRTIEICGYLLVTGGWMSHEVLTLHHTQQCP
jgi:hypothetical protein